MASPDKTNSILRKQNTEGENNLINKIDNKSIYERSNKVMEKARQDYEAVKLAEIARKGFAIAQKLLDEFGSSSNIPTEELEKYESGKESIMIDAGVLLSYCRVIEEDNVAQ